MKKIPCSLFVVLSGTCLGAAEVNWQPAVDMGNQLFPSYIIATATVNFDKQGQPPTTYLGDVNGQIGIRVLCPAKGAKLSLEISSSRLIKKSTFDGVLKDEGVWYRVYPTIEYDYEALYATREPVPETITYTLKINGVDVGTKKKVIQVRSVNDCPFRVVEGTNEMTDISWMFAAYVNENHPKVDQILKAAIATGVVRNFKGYQGSKQDVMREASAIWAAFQNLGFRYSSITTPSGFSEKVTAQHVRFIGDSLSASQANCVDGSVLFASVLRKIGLDTYLVLVPGHCMVGFYLDRQRTGNVCVETTMLGKVDRQKHFNDKDPLAELLAGLTGGKTANQASLSSFRQAAYVATQRVKKDLDKFQGTKREPAYSVIEIDKARKLGILPLKEVAAKAS